MKLLKLLLSTLLILVLACNSAKRIVKKKDMSEECKGSIVWLYNSLERKNGLLEVKFENFEQDTAFQNDLWKKFSVCTFGRNLTKSEVKKLYGEPNKITIGTRTQHETFYYIIKSENCQDGLSVHVRNYTCGHIRFEFDKEGTPIGGFIQLLESKDLH